MITSPVVALDVWLKLARPLFRRVTGKGEEVGPEERLADKHVARLLKRAALAAGVRGDPTEGDGGRNSRGIRCAPVSRPRPRSTSVTSRSSSTMPQPR
jgi:hypothetical protein